MIHQPIEHGEGSRSVAFPGFVLGLLLLAWAPSCGEAPPPSAATSSDALRLQGPTMGTSWSASLHGADPAVDWQLVLQAELDEIEAILTTWDPSSELMVFNASGPAPPDTVVVSLHLAKCLDEAHRAAELTQGAFDPTVQPLVELWGFGKERDLSLPSEEQIEEALSKTAPQGFAVIGVHDKLLLEYGYLTEDQVREPQAQKDPSIRIDLSAIAKGYAADCLAELAEARGIKGGLIEVGGEIVVFGDRSDGELWRIGIEAPAEHPGAPRVIGSVIELDSSGDLSAVATSGDSRNRRTIGDFTFSHIIDPRTGWPLVDPPAAVTVVAPTCAIADAWATALMVLGPEEGLPLATAAGLEVCFQLREEDGRFRSVATDGYEGLVAKRLHR